MKNRSFETFTNDIMHVLCSCHAAIWCARVEINSGVYKTTLLRYFRVLSNATLILISKKTKNLEQFCSKLRFSAPVVKWRKCVRTDFVDTPP